MRAWRVGILIFNQDTNWISREPVRDRGYISLLFALEQRAIGHASHGLHLDFRFFVIRDDCGGLGDNDQRLRAIACIEGALELQRLNAALLAGVLLQRGLKHLRLRMQLVGDFRRHHRHHHRHRRFDFDAHLHAVMVRREAAINL